MNRLTKENLYDAVTMFVNQIAMMVFATMLTFSVELLTDRAGVSNSLQNGLRVGTSLISIVFYCYLLSYKCYEMGQKDGIKIEAKRLIYNPWKCFFISLIANIPNILLGLIELIGKLCIKGVSLMEPVVEHTSGELSPEWAINMHEISLALAKFLHMMYVGVGQVFFAGVGFYDLLTPFVAVLVCTVSYRLGVRYCNGMRNASGKSKENASRYQ